MAKSTGRLMASHPMEANLDNSEQLLNDPTSWQEKYLQPIVISLLMLALFSGFIIILEIIVPDGPWSFLPWLILLISAESILTTRWLATTETKVSHLTYRTAEITVILLFLRLFTWLFITGLPGSSEIQGFLFEPASFFDPIFTVFSILLFFVWQQTSTMMGTFLSLRLDNDELYYYSTESHERYKLSRPEIKNRKEFLENYFKQWLIGGLILSVLATATTFDLSPLGSESLPLRTIGRLGLRPVMLASLLVYFIGGLWLAGQGQLARMRSQWLLQDIESDPTMNRIWHRSSLALIAIVAAIAAFLPIGSTFAISRILQLLTLAVIVVVNVIFAILSTALFLILSIFLKPGAEETAEPLNLSEIVPDQFMLPPPPDQPPSALLGGLFWLVVVAAVIMALIFFLRGRGLQLSGSTITKFLSTTWLRFTTWLSSLWKGLSSQVQQLEQSIRERLQMSDSASTNRLSWGRPPFRSLSPREKIRYYYLSVVRRAEEKGIERASSETPYEYATDLKQQWPEADNEVEAITEAFLKARYSPQPVTGEDIGPVKETWNRIKTTIRKRRS